MSMRNWRGSRAARRPGLGTGRSGPAPREPGTYDLHGDRWVPARDVRAPDLTQRLPREARYTR